MTLTQNDLTAIGQLLDQKINPIQEDVNSLKLDAKSLKKDVKTLTRDVKSMKKDLNWVIGKYDTRLVHLEHHTAHPPRQTL